MIVTILLSATFWALQVPLVSQPEDEDWPTFRHDRFRSGVSTMEIRPRTLIENWVHIAPTPPSPAWPAPARWDAYARLEGLKPMRQYDPVFHVVATGDGVFFGSSSNDTLYRLDIETGAVVWSFRSGGPIRVAPSVAEGRVYFGSDDGSAYCLSAQDGQLLWSHTVHEGRKLINNARLISAWPIRTGVLVDDGLAYFAGSLLPWRDSFLVAVDAQTGSSKAVGTFRRDLGTGWTMEGALLASEKTIYLPQGRVPPLLFDREQGKPRGSLKGGGGSFVLLTQDQRVLHGPGNKKGWITDSDTQSLEKVASYDRGNAIVVKDDHAYLLGDKSLTAMNRSAKKITWNVKCRTPLELIAVGDVLFSGGDGKVEARDVEDGSLLWTAPVDGRAFGLAAARGRLLVSTDKGKIYAFRQGAQSLPLPEVVKENSSLRPSPPIPPLKDRSLLDRWVFQPSQLDSMGALKSAKKNGRRAHILGTPQWEDASKVQALVLDGQSGDLEVESNFRRGPFPKRDLTAEAWVRIDRPTQWGGILSMTQDNGDYERGWMLGYRESKFGFALAAERGSGRLTWLLADKPFEEERWYHIAGTFDGKTMRLYVDGREVAQSDEQKGSIAYPEEGYYHLGAYRDKDEYFKMQGRLQEVLLYKRCLSALDVRKRFEAKKAQFPEASSTTSSTKVARSSMDTSVGPELEEGPYLTFVDATTAQVRWKTPSEVPSELVHRIGSSEHTLIDPRPKRDHVMPLTDLAPKSVTFYSIRAPSSGGDPGTTEEYECDTHFNFNDGFTKAPEVDGELSALESSLLVQIQKDFPHPRGLCVLAGLESEELSMVRMAAALIDLGPWNVILLTSKSDPTELHRERTKLQASGLPASRVSLISFDRELPCLFANLMIAAEGQPYEAQWVRPDGGIAYLQTPPQKPSIPIRSKTPLGEWIRIERDSLKGAGSWTHMYGRPDNTAYGGEDLGGATSTEDLEVQWLGRPGPRHQSDRQNRKPAPLAVSGRLHIQGLGRMITLDAFNGSVLWSLEVPRMRRFNIPRSSSNWCADERDLFVALGQQALRLEGQDGSIRERLSIPDEATPKNTPNLEWGYIARVGSLLLGSTVPSDSQFQDFWGKEKWFDAKEGPSAAKVCSHSLFALDAQSSETAWTYTKGSIIEPTITATESHVYFVANEDASFAGRAVGDTLFEGLSLICLDLASGRREWSQPISPLPGSVVIYLAIADGRLLLQTSKDGQFALEARSAEDGSLLWTKTFPWEVDHHGKHLSRPLIVGGRIYIRPLTIDLVSGKTLAEAFPEGHQCGSYAASTHALFLRAGDMAIWDWKEGTSSSWTRLRPDCWISTIPANGMLLSPEGGGGCSCGSWIETSIGFVPRSLASRES